MKWSTTFEARIEDNMKPSPCRHGGASPKRVTPVGSRHNSPNTRAARRVAFISVGQRSSSSRHAARSARRYSPVPTTALPARRVASSPGNLHLTPRRKGCVRRARKAGTIADQRVISKNHDIARAQWAIANDDKRAYHEVRDVLIFGASGLTRACSRPPTRTATRGTWLVCRRSWVGAPCP
jgi:hypothetical protein